MSDLLRLATELRQLTKQQLGEVLVAGNYLENPPHDLFELARSLLTRRQMEPKIRRLNLSELEKLKGGKTSKLLQGLQLADPIASFEAATELAQILEAAKNKQPKLEAKAHQSAALASYETLLAITELIFATERHWLKYMKTGLRAPDAKWLSERVQLEPKEIQNRFDLAVAAGLIIRENDRWLFTLQGESWLELNAEDRWLKLATAVLDLPQGFLPELNQDVFEGLVGEFPIIETEGINFLKFGEALSLMSAGKLTELGLVALKNPSKAAKELAKQLPKPANRLVVQADLTITSPGPLSVELHRELDYFAESEDLGIAARFRLSALSITHALEAGKSIEAIEEFLVKHSGTLLPQPVQYLLSETSNKLGTLVVTEGNESSVITATDSILLLQIQNENALSSLGLRKNSDNSLESFVAAEVLYFNLREVGYPAIMKDQSGKILNPRHPAVRSVQLTELDPERAAEKLLNAEAVEVAVDEKLRQLQFALKNKMKVFVKIEMPNQQLVDMELEPLGIAGNRLRGRDVVKQAERTLPLSAIRSIQLG